MALAMRRQRQLGFGPVVTASAALFLFFSSTLAKAIPGPFPKAAPVAEALPDPTPAAEAFAAPVPVAEALPDPDGTSNIYAPFSGAIYIIDGSGVQFSAAQPAVCPAGLQGCGNINVWNW
jgi:hypothetical protein